MQENQENLFTYEEAARELGIALGSLKQAINRGSLHPIKLPHQRRKFLSKEDLNRYRGGKREYETPQAASSSSVPGMHPTSTMESASSSVPRVPESEQMRLLFIVAGMGWSSNSTAVQKMAEAVQKMAEAVQRATSDNAASIRDTVVAALQFYASGSLDTKGVEGKSADTLVQRGTGDQATAFIGQLHEILTRNGALSSIDAQALQEAQRFFGQSASVGDPTVSMPEQEAIRKT